MMPTLRRFALPTALIVFGALSLGFRHGDDPVPSKNIIPNGDFSQGNVGFKTELPYVEPAFNCLWPNGYTIASVFNDPQLHTLIAIEPFSAPHKRTGKENVFFANVGGVDPVMVWSAQVKCEPKTQYRISFLCASLSGHEDNGTPPRQVPSEDWVPNFEIRANKDVSPEFTAGQGKFYRASMLWNSTTSKTATIKIVRTKFPHGGGLIAISNIEMVPVKGTIKNEADSE